MPAFMVISRHSPESCWMFNPKTRQIHLDLVRNLDAILQKHGVAMLGCWFDIPGHALYEIYDAPDYAAIQGMTMEPEILAWSSFNTMRVLPVTSVDEVNAFLQQPASQA